MLCLADRLRADGIDAEIDQYNTAPPEGWPLWCERQIAAAAAVLIVCTETYYRRVSGDEERGKGLGVIWEARIIRQHLYDTGATSDKFVPVLFSDASPEQIPMPIRGWTRYVVDTEDGYEDLYRRLTRQPSLVRPKLGAIRPLPPRRRQWTEAQSKATTAPAPSSSAARSPADGIVAEGSNHSVAIGGDMISSAAVFGDHNVTHINTGSDNNEVRQRRLKEFSNSAECDAMVGQLHASLDNTFKKKGRRLSGYGLFSICITLYMTFLSRNFVIILFAFPLLILALQFFCFSDSFLSVDIFAAAIVEKYHTSEHNMSQAHLVLEKENGSRIALTPMYLFSLPAMLQHAVERGGVWLMEHHFDKLPIGAIGIAVASKTHLYTFVFPRIVFLPKSVKNGPL